VDVSIRETVWGEASPLGANVGYVGGILVPVVSKNAKLLEAFA